MLHGCNALNPARGYAQTAKYSHAGTGLALELGISHPVPGRKAPEFFDVTMG